jgi:two-component system alkaline phosphatase synthesis response regulator PhoP
MPTYSAATILIVEDEKNLGETLLEYLQSLGYVCSWANSVQNAKKQFEEIQGTKIVLMDIGLPDGSGLDLARAWKQQNPQLVLIFLSAQNDPETRVSGLEIGGDDFINKPFELKELKIRLDRLLAKFDNRVAEFGNLIFYFDRFEVAINRNEILPLATKECQIFQYLYERKDRAVNREEIIEKIWGATAYPSNRTVDNYIVNLRKLCEHATGIEIKIRSIRGIGYKLETSEVKK